HRHDSRLDGSPAPELALHSGAGTVGWVAPEQIRKAATHVGPPTDLYALGCIMYRVLTGKEVFEGNAQDVLRAHKRSPVPALKLADGVPMGVSGFVQRMLAKRPWHRFEFAADARRAWRRFAPTGAYPKAHMAARSSPLSIPPAREISSSTDGGSGAEPQPTTTGLLGLRPSPFVARGAERTRLLDIAAQVAETGGHRFVL